MRLHTFVGREILERNSQLATSFLSILLSLAMVLTGLPSFAQDQVASPTTEGAGKNLLVEWKHLDQWGQTCVRCTATGKTLAQVIEEMRTRCASQGIEVRFLETRLTVARLKESNEILFNGTPLENLLPQATVFESDCPSCATLTGQPSCCRGVAIGQRRYEEIPEELIWQAACAVMNCSPSCQGLTQEKKNP